MGRAILDRETIHIHDLWAERESEFPDIWHAVDRMGIRTALAVPLAARGCCRLELFMIRRTEVRPFSDKQIALLKTFAAQAVIAIENVRLFKELQDRNAICARRWSIRRRRVEVLSIISRSPTDVQPVLDALVESAARVCGIEGVTLRLDGEFGPLGAM